MGSVEVEGLGAIDGLDQADMDEVLNAEIELEEKKNNEDLSELCYLFKVVLIF